MEGWRKTPVRERPVAWLIQETHVSTTEERQEVEEVWQRLWGLQHRKDKHTLSFWSQDQSKTGGVAILLNPEVAQETKPWKPEFWTKRRISVEYNGLVIMSVYAPSTHAEREIFFTELKRFKGEGNQWILAGDFNSVQSPPLDRLGGKRSGRPESAALQGLCELLNLEDARTLQDHAVEVTEDPEPIDFYTYWGPKAASRLDRLFVDSGCAKEVQEVEVSEPRMPSDHQRVQLILRKGEKQPPRKRHKDQVKYPIRTAQPDKVIDALLEEMTNQGVGKDVSLESWDEAIKKCVQNIKQVKARDTNRRRKAVNRLEAQYRAGLYTRRELLNEREEAAREEQLIREGQRLDRTTEQLRRQFKRVAIWEKDQTVSEIIQLNGDKFAKGMTIADKFASEWSPILSRTHNAVTGANMEGEFDKFVRIPGGRKLTGQQNHALMKEVTLNEVVQAFGALNRHKAARPDGLNNDFYKDAQALLVQPMINIANELVQGGTPPASFLQGMLIPLRKKGDSNDAMDYRLIALLQTGYKIFAKIVATRVQEVLGVAIGDSQQGFVHGGQMLKTVMMMMAVLGTAKDEHDLDKGNSRAILLLDFRKAYDTVARDFLFMTLQKFGFQKEFIDMVRKLHLGTTAQFLVNQELSQSLPVKTGIRQGCPLAPLLFILAAAVLSIALNADQEITGIQIPHSNGKRQKFSAFVDDSTVFVQQAQQIPKVLQIVKQFGDLAGLRVQPAKSKIIFLNTAVSPESFGGISVLAHGDTERYLGYAVGTGDMTTVNWASRNSGSASNSIATRNQC